MASHKPQEVVNFYIYLFLFVGKKYRKLGFCMVVLLFQEIREIVFWIYTDI